MGFFLEFTYFITKHDIIEKGKTILSKNLGNGYSFSCNTLLQACVRLFDVFIDNCRRFVFNQAQRHESEKKYFHAIKNIK